MYYQAFPRLVCTFALSLFDKHNSNQISAKYQQHHTDRKNQVSASCTTGTISLNTGIKRTQFLPNSLTQSIMQL